MLAVILCLAGVFVLLAVSEFLGRKKNLRGDFQRQFIHITVGSFVASWPWLISWRAIAWLGVVMLAGVLINHKLKIVDFHSKINRQTYGDIAYALAIIFAALLTDEKVFFALAILIMAISDGLATLVGRKWGKKWRYKIFYQPKTVVGSMAFWLSAIFILGAGLLLAIIYDDSPVGFRDYAILVLGLPPILVILENISFMGLDNLVVTVATILLLNLAK